FHLLADDVAFAARRSHTNNRERKSIQPDLAIDNRWGERKFALPVSVTQHSYRTGIFGYIIGLREQATCRGLQSEHAEIVPAHHASDNFFRNGFAGPHT